MDIRLFSVTNIIDKCDLGPDVVDITHATIDENFGGCFFQIFDICDAFLRV
jgi:lipoprotein signal peptidase